MSLTLSWPVGAGRCRPGVLSILSLTWTFVAIFTLAVQATPAEQKPRPNIVVILADDLGYSDLGCYGSEIPTPHLDRLASRGVRFSQFYNTARCWPSRAALMTGYYAQQVRRDAMPGVAGGGRGVRPSWAPMLPALLQPLGYRSYHSGKWHLDGTCRAAGFERSYRLEDHNHFFSPDGQWLDDEPIDQAASPSYATTLIADRTLEFLAWHAEHHKNDPFFAYVAFTSPHFPLQAPAEDIARHQETYKAGWETIRQKRWERQQKLGLPHRPLSAVERDLGPPYPFPDALEKLGPGEVNRPLIWSEMTAEQQAFQAAKMSVHAAMVDRMDAEIGRIVDHLERRGQLDNTLIVFVSDNGASAEIMVRGSGHDRSAAPGSAGTYLCLGPGWSTVANTPFRRHKTWVHEGGIATPCIISWPAGLAARGEWRHEPAHLIDLVPTLLELAGTDPSPMPEPTRPGESLVDILQEGATLPNRPLWWYHEGNRALRLGDWKIVAAGAQGPWELYHLASDPTEQANLADKEPERLQALVADYEALSDQIRTDANREPAPEESPPPRPRNPKKKAAPQSTPQTQVR